MARAKKTPKKEYYNQAVNCFGHYQVHGGKWQDYIETSKSTVLEIGCGKADFGLQLARANRNINVIGTDLKSVRMSKAAKQALAENLTNIAFLQTNTTDLLNHFIAGSISQIWLTFPDPHPKKRGAKHRMTGPKFLDIYHQLLDQNGTFNFKTDSQALFEWTLEQIISHNKFTIDDLVFDLHDSKGRKNAKLITAFEARFIEQGLTTKFLSASKR